MPYKNKQKMEEVQHKQKKTWSTLHHLYKIHKGYKNNYIVYKQTGLKK